MKRLGVLVSTELAAGAFVEAAGGANDGGARETWGADEGTTTEV